MSDCRTSNVVSTRAGSGGSACVVWARLALSGMMVTERAGGALSTDDGRGGGAVAVAGWASRLSASIRLGTGTGAGAVRGSRVVGRRWWPRAALAGGGGGGRPGRLGRVGVLRAGAVRAARVLAGAGRANGLRVEEDGGPMAATGRQREISCALMATTFARLVSRDASIIIPLAVMPPLSKLVPSRQLPLVFRHPPL